MFTGGVVRGAGGAAKSVGGTDDHNCTTGTQVRYGRLDGVPDTGQVDVERLLPDLAGQLPCGSTLGVNTGVGDNDIQATQRRHARVDRLRQVVTISDVGDTGDAAPALVLQGGRRTRQIVGRRGGIDGDDIGARIGEALAVRTTG